MGGVRGGEVTNTFLTLNTDFKARNPKFEYARVAHIVSNLSPRTWILICETGKSGPREWRMKCLILDLKHEF